jgi:hypothetical protein
MRGFFAAILSVIAAGVLLVAYGLLVPRTPQAFDAYGYPAARPMLAGERLAVVDEGNGFVRLAQPVRDLRDLSAYAPAPAAPRVVSTRTTRAVPARTVSKPRRDWTKTALVIGGSTATGAGVGALIGGKKGALVGAALGGGAGTLFEVVKR